MLPFYEPEKWIIILKRSSVFTLIYQIPFQAAIHAAMAAKRFLKRSPGNILKKDVIVERGNRNGTRLKTGV